MSQTDETRSITKSINVVDGCRGLQEIRSAWRSFMAQMVPNDKAEDFMSLLIK